MRRIEVSHPREPRWRLQIFINNGVRQETRRIWQSATSFDLSFYWFESPKIRLVRVSQDHILFEMGKTGKPRTIWLFARNKGGMGAGA